MTNRKKPLVLQQLAKDSAELPAMLADLGGGPALGLKGIAPSRWGWRFAASGKSRCATAPRIRLE